MKSVMKTENARHRFSGPSPTISLRPLQGVFIHDDCPTMSSMLRLSISAWSTFVQKTDTHPLGRGVHHFFADLFGQETSSRFLE